MHRRFLAKGERRCIKLKGARCAHPFRFQCTEEAMVYQNGYAPKHFTGAHYEFFPLHFFSALWPPIRTLLVFPSGFNAASGGYAQFLNIIDKRNLHWQLRRRSLSE